MMGRKYLKKLNWNGWIERGGDNLELYRADMTKPGQHTTEDTQPSVSTVLMMVKLASARRMEYAIKFFDCTVSIPDHPPPKVE